MIPAELRVSKIILGLPAARPRHARRTAGPPADREIRTQRERPPDAAIEAAEIVPEVRTANSNDCPCCVIVAARISSGQITAGAAETRGCSGSREPLAGAASDTAQMPSAVSTARRMRDMRLRAFAERRAITFRVTPGYRSGRGWALLWQVQEEGWKPLASTPPGYFQCLLLSTAGAYRRSRVR